MTIKCKICGINEAQIKDYRKIDGDYSKYIVCHSCGLLNNKWFFRLKYAKEGIGKKRIMAQIVEGTWKGYLIKISNNQVI